MIHQAYKFHLFIRPMEQTQGLLNQFKDGNQGGAYLYQRCGPGFAYINYIP